MGRRRFRNPVELLPAKGRRYPRRLLRDQVIARSVSRPVRSGSILLIGLLLASCATAWQDSGSFYRNAQTALAVDSAPTGAQTFLNNRYLGYTPLSTTLECEQEIRKRTRRVTYWETQPGLSLFISLMSLGLYIPFSLIPVDTETSQQPSGSFKSNEFTLRVEAEGYKPWSTIVVCGPRPAVSLHAVLEKL